MYSWQDFLYCGNTLYVSSHAIIDGKIVKSRDGEENI